LAGALTSTPGLAAGVEAAGPDSGVAIGFGIAYPVGVIAVVLFVQFLPRALKQDWDTLGREAQMEGKAQRTIERALIEIANPAMAGKHPTDIAFLEQANAAITRRLQDGRLVPIEANDELRQGDHVIVVADSQSMPSVIEALGQRSDQPYTMDTETERRNVVVTARSMLHQRLGDLRLLKRFGVTVSRITRQDVSFVPTAETRLQRADVLTVVGAADRLEAFAEAAGHSQKALEATDLISMGLGIAAGIALGMITFPLPGLGGFSLGLAGGPLLVALGLSHFGRIGPVVGYMPRPSRMLLTEIGLSFFLAPAGVQAGASLIEVLKEYGVLLVLAGAVITLLPMVAAIILGRCAFKLNLLELLGGVCGGMTSTPALGAIASKTDAQAPVLGYAAAYPVALILMTVATQLVIGLLA
jgi:putative transport protein